MLRYRCARSVLLRKLSLWLPFLLQWVWPGMDLPGKVGTVREATEAEKRRSKKNEIDLVMELAFRAYGWLKIYIFRSA